MNVTHYLTGPTRILLGLVAVTATAVHFRGKARLRFCRAAHRPFDLHGALQHVGLPGLARADRPFLDPADFPELTPLAENWQVIRDEAPAPDRRRPDARRRRLQRPRLPFVLPARLEALLPEVVRPAAAVRARAVPAHRGAPRSRSRRVNGAMFATLPPTAKLGRHRDPFAGVAALPPRPATPNSDACCIVVDGEPYVWRDGEAVMFDETFIHQAREPHRPAAPDPVLRRRAAARRADAVRINRWVMRHVMRRTGSPNETGEPAGAINRLYAAPRRRSEGDQGPEGQEPSALRGAEVGDHPRRTGPAAGALLSALIAD